MMPYFISAGISSSETKGAVLIVEFQAHAAFVGKSLSNQS
jgi:hypothetical protein